MRYVIVVPPTNRLRCVQGLYSPDPMDFAEAKAREYGYTEIHLYTNEVMHQNVGLYKSLGYEETARRLDSGFRRVFMKKTL